MDQGLHETGSFCQQILLGRAVASGLNDIYFQEAIDTLWLICSTFRPMKPIHSKNLLGIVGFMVVTLVVSFPGIALAAESLEQRVATLEAATDLSQHGEKAYND